MVSSGRSSLRATMAASALASAATLSAQPAPAPPVEVRIGVIDSGASPSVIRDKNARMVSRTFHDGVQAGWDGSTYYSHGDKVALSALAGARALAPDAHVAIFAANVYMPSDAVQSDQDTRIRYRISYEATHKALDWMKAQGVSVIVFAGTGADTEGMRGFVEHARRDGMVLVASTNNVASSGKVYPAAYPDVLAVAGDDPSLPVFSSPMLASYVTCVSTGRASVKDLGEVGSARTRKRS